jgi:adenosylcobyric acid synthase
MTAASIMFAGTGSDVGKSLLVAGLARAYTRRGLTVRPFKPQNMSNNAAVTMDGGEIGRAQALQARAARCLPMTDMNPVLLKPQSDVGSQVVVQGRVAGTAKARDYQAWKPRLMTAVQESFARLASEADLVLVEGAGSIAEINLRANDIANMGFAAACGVPVVVIGDIDRGGVIAQLVGTNVVLSDADRAMVRGFIVNRFRGDPRLFADGMSEIAARTGWTPIGLVPFFDGAADLPAEDAVALERPTHVTGPAAGDDDTAPVRVVVLAYPRVSNFDDFDPLKLDPAFDLRFVRPGTALPGDADLVILPGSKATIADLAALRDTGWDIDLAAHVRRGGHLWGICGGYQMLGRRIADPDGIEGPPQTVDGLGFLDVETVLTGEKVLVEACAQLNGVSEPVTGYEMHIGRTSGPDATAAPVFDAPREGSGHRPATSFGATDPSGRIMGHYLHGFFANDPVRGWLSIKLGGAASAINYDGRVEEALDRLSEHLEVHLDLDQILQIAKKSQQSFAP